MRGRLSDLGVVGRAGIPRFPAYPLILTAPGGPLIAVVALWDRWSGGSPNGFDLAVANFHQLWWLGLGGLLLYTVGAAGLCCGQWVRRRLLSRGLRPRSAVTGALILPSALFVVGAVLIAISVT